MTIRYLHLPVGSEPPTIGQDGPFKAIVISEQKAEEGWRDRIGEWLVRSGCLFMMAWGQNAEAWDDSVDWALLRVHDFEDVPDEKHVLTTWHDDEPLAEVFWFSGHAAKHDAAPDMHTWIIDIHADDRQAVMLEDYAAAQADDPVDFGTKL